MWRFSRCCVVLHSEGFTCDTTPHTFNHIAGLSQFSTWGSESLVVGEIWGLVKSGGEGKKQICDVFYVCNAKQATDSGCKWKRPTDELMRLAQYKIVCSK